MTKREVFVLLGMISVYYDQFEVDQNKIDLWYEALKGNSFVKMEENLMAFVAESVYPPRIANLVKKSYELVRTVPTMEETHAMFTSHWETANKETIQAELSKLREILGIRRDPC